METGACVRDELFFRCRTWAASSTSLNARPAHRQILVPAREPSRPRISAIASHTTAKLAIRQEVHQLGEDGLALIHAPLSPTQNRPSGPVAIQIAASQIPVQLSATKAFVGGELAISRTVVVWSTSSFRSRRPTIAPDLGHLLGVARSRRLGRDFRVVAEALQPELEVSILRVERQATSCKIVPDKSLQKSLTYLSDFS